MSVPTANWSRSLDLGQHGVVVERITNGNVMISCERLWKYHIAGYAIAARLRSTLWLRRASSGQFLPRSTDQGGRLRACAGAVECANPFTIPRTYFDLRSRYL